MSEEFNQNKLMEVLDWAYDKAVNGVPGFDSAEELGNDYLKGNAPLEDKVNALIRWQNAKCATSGFLSGLGGIITLPVSIPANIASVMYVQIRMIAAIAYMGGYDIRDDRVKTFVYMCLLGNGAKDIFKETVVNLGTKLSMQTIKSISGKVLTEINQKIGFRLITKFGEKGLINLGKMIPLVGALIMALLDSFSTDIIGNVARDTFIDGSIVEVDNLA